MRQGKGIAAVLGLLLLLSGCGGQDGPEPSNLSVLAAASTTDVMTELARLYEEQAGVDVRLSLAASSTLARQMEAGAPFDVYLSANPRWMDHVEGAGLVRADSRFDLLGNTLVLVAPRGRSFAVEPRPDFPVAEAFEGHLALGDPTHVPAGLYAREALERLGWWRLLEERVVPAATVRAALRLVELGEAGAGVVYRTDAAVTERVAIVAEIPPGFTPPIVYPIALSREAGPEAEAFLSFLASPAARAVFERAGFRWLGERIAVLTPEEWAVLGLSLKVALGCVLVVSAPAIGAGWLLARKQFPGKAVLDALLHLPLVLPPVAVGYLLLVTLGSQGPLGRLLDDWFGLRLAFTWRAAVVASAIMGFPLMVRAVRLAVELVDPRIEEAARTLGASPLRVFFSVTLPLSLPGVLTGMLLAFARSLGEFGATIAFAGNLEGETRTLSLAIFTWTQVPGGDGPALRLVALSFVLALGALIASEWLARMTRRRLGAD